MAYTTIDKPTDYFNTKLYTGNNTTDTAITGIGFQPDWVWVKRRSSTQFHGLVDSVRGATKQLASNSSNAEDTNTESLKSFDSDGFTIGTSPRLNASSETYVAWNWLAGGTASSNTDGSITSSVSANTTAGFSIVSYTGNATNGATVGHGLGAVPDMLIGKDLSDASGWGIWHKNLSGATYRLAFTPDAQSNDSALFGGSGNTLPTSTVFTLGSGGGLNGSNANIVYAFTSIKGFSRFGSYVGNGSSNGSMIWCDFKPAFFILKASDAQKGWYMYDNKRDGGFNVNDDSVLANTNDAEFSSNIDFLSNGVKIRTSGTGENQSGTNYIFMAFAENPFVTSTGIPTTAR